MSEYVATTLETGENRRVKLVLSLTDELHRRGYDFFNFDGSPRDTPDLIDNSFFEFARSIRRLHNSGFFWKDRNYSVQIAGKFSLKDPYQVQVEIKGKDEFGVIERMVASLNEDYSLEPRTEFKVELKSQDYEIWTTHIQRQFVKDKQRFEAAKRDKHSF